LLLSWGLASGTTYTSGTQPTAWENAVSANRFAGLNVNLADSTSNEWYITGVQLELGETATPFEHRSYGDELARCQRYAYNISIDGSGDFGAGACTSGGAQVFVPYQTTMRSNPSVSFSSAGNFLIADGTSGYTVTSTGTSTIQPHQTTVNMGASGTSGGRCGILRRNTGTAFILFDAEL